MILAEQWVTENVDHLFQYAMAYIANAEIAPPPQFHLVDSTGRSATVMCDFWDYDDENKDYQALGAALDKFAESFGAVACLFTFIGEIDDIEIIGILTYKNSNPRLYYKPIIWTAGIVDFGPLSVLPWHKVTNLQF